MCGSSSKNQRIQTWIFPVGLNRFYLQMHDRFICRGGGGSKWRILAQQGLKIQFLIRGCSLYRRRSEACNIQCRMTPETQQTKKRTHVRIRLHKMILRRKREFVCVVSPLSTYCQHLFVGILLWGPCLGLKRRFRSTNFPSLESVVLHELFALYSLNKNFFIDFLISVCVFCLLFLFSIAKIFFARTNLVGENENLLKCRMPWLQKTCYKLFAVS